MRIDKQVRKAVELCDESDKKECNTHKENHSLCDKQDTHILVFAALDDGKHNQNGLIEGNIQLYGCFLPKSRNEGPFICKCQ
jgi:hypothetical protein